MNVVSQHSCEIRWYQKSYYQIHSSTDWEPMQRKKKGQKHLLIFNSHLEMLRPYLAEYLALYLASAVIN